MSSDQDSRKRKLGAMYTPNNENKIVIEPPFKKPKTNSPQNPSKSSTQATTHAPKINTNIPKMQPSKLSKSKLKINFKHTKIQNIKPSPYFIASNAHSKANALFKWFDLSKALYAEWMIKSSKLITNHHLEMDVNYHIKKGKKCLIILVTCPNEQGKRICVGFAQILPNFELKWCHIVDIPIAIFERAHDKKKNAFLSDKEKRLMLSLLNIMLSFRKYNGCFVLKKDRIINNQLVVKTTKQYHSTMPYVSKHEIEYHLKLKQLETKMSNFNIYNSNNNGIKTKCVTRKPPTKIEQKETSLMDVDMDDDHEFDNDQFMGDSSSTNQDQFIFHAPLKDKENRTFSDLEHDIRVIEEAIANVKTINDFNKQWRQCESVQKELLLLNESIEHGLSLLNDDINIDKNKIYSAFIKLYSAQASLSLSKHGKIDKYIIYNKEVEFYMQHCNYDTNKILKLISYRLLANFRKGEPNAGIFSLPRKVLKNNIIKDTLKIIELINNTNIGKKNFFSIDLDPVQKLILRPVIPKIRFKIVKKIAKTYSPTSYPINSLQIKIGILNTQNCVNYIQEIKGIMDDDNTYFDCKQSRNSLTFSQ